MSPLLGNPIRTGLHTFALAGRAIDVRDRTQGTLEWLVENLTPSFELVGRRGPVSVEIVREEPAPPLPDPVPHPVFALESGLARLPGARLGDATVVDAGTWGIRLRIHPHGVRISAASESVWPRASGMRVVRELALADALGSGHYLQLHASCVEQEGRCIALVGPKRAGKTTTAAHVASCTGAGLVGNDRILLDMQRPERPVVGVPTLVTVRPETVHLLPGRFASVPDVARPLRLTLAESETALSRHGPVTEPRELNLSPAQLVRTLGVEASRGGVLAAVAVVSVDPNAEGYELEPIPAEAVPPLLAEFSFGRAAREEELTVFERARGVRAAPVRIPEHLARLPAFRLSVGEGFLRSRAAPEELLGTLVTTPDRP